MTWNYRIVRYANGDGYGLHEVMYDADGQPWAMTENPISFVCGPDEGPQGIRQSLLLARVDAIKREVFEEPADGKWPGKPPSEKIEATFNNAEEMMAYLNR